MWLAFAVRKAEFTAACLGLRLGIGAALLGRHVLHEEVEPMGGLEPPTSPLPRECSTTELHGLEGREFYVAEQKKSSLSSVFLVFAFLPSLRRQKFLLCDVRRSLEPRRCFQPPARPPGGGSANEAWQIAKPLWYLAKAD